jgi:hypothetical protein
MAQWIHVAGYTFAFSGSNCVLLASAQNKTMQPEKSANPNPFLPPVYQNVSDRELFTDCTICSSVTVPSTPKTARYSWPNITYTEVQGGFYLKHLSPHLNGVFPSGGNIGFKDGHVTWRKFDDMSQQAGGGQGFWW